MNVKKNMFTFKQNTLSATIIKQKRMFKIRTPSSRYDNSSNSFHTRSYFTTIFFPPRM